MSNTDNKFNPANIFAILGFALLFIIAIWSAVQVVKYAPRVLGSSFSKIFSSAPQVDIKLDKTLFNTNEEINIKWDLSGNIDGGNLAFLYECKKGIRFDVYDEAQKTWKVLPCNTPFNLSLDSRELKLKAHSTIDLDDVAIAIVYVNSKGKKYKDISKISIKNDSAPSLAQDSSDSGDATEGSNASTTSQSASYNEGKEGTVSQSNSESSSARQSQTHRSVSRSVSDKCVSKIYGTPDLKVYDLKIGYIAPNGYFIEKSSFAKNESMVIRFRVLNAGTKTSPSWSFNLALPALKKSLYTSAAQPKLAPCKGRLYTVTVQNAEFIEGNNLVSVTADPQNLIYESNERNNSAVKTIYIY